MNLKFWTWGKQSQDVDNYFKDERTLGHAVAVEVKEPKNKDVSEPVYAFIKCFQANPKRFRLTKFIKSDTRASLRTQRLDFTDTQTNQTWRVYKYPIGYGGNPYIIIDADWMTDDEKSLITKTIIKYYIDRSTERARILTVRAKRKLDNERKRLMTIYT